MAGDASSDGNRVTEALDAQVQALTEQLVQLHLRRRQQAPSDSVEHLTGGSLVVAISGIDGAGKGFISSLLQQDLSSRALRVAVVGLDGWLNLPHIRHSNPKLAGFNLDPNNTTNPNINTNITPTITPGEHFYHHAFRFNELFSQLITPLRRDRSVRVTYNHADETALDYREATYEASDIDIILLEGIFLLQQSFVEHYDYLVWVECSFGTALSRAVVRAQEGLSPDDTVKAYEGIYFPAQRVHFARDAPRSRANFVIVNNT
eukprot:jgi/Chlat1/5314/Chrsp35S05260